MNLRRAGVDIAKSVFHVHAVDCHDQLGWQAKLKRTEWLNALCQHLAPGAEVGMEACASAHHWARKLQERGFRVKLIGAQFVKPYVKSNKNDRVDAEAICEAMSRPVMPFVAVKSIAQQDPQAAQRTREALVGQRTAKANQIPGLAGEHGIVAPKGILQRRRASPDWLEDAENALTADFRSLLADLAEDLPPRHRRRRRSRDRSRSSLPAVPSGSRGKSTRRCCSLVCRACADDRSAVVDQGLVGRRGHQPAAGLRNRR